MQYSFWSRYGKPEIVACPFDRTGTGSNRALDPTLDETYSFLTQFLSEQATVFGAQATPLGISALLQRQSQRSFGGAGDRVINVYGDEVRFPCWNSSTTIKAWMQANGLADGDFQGLTKYLLRRPLEPS